MSAHVLPKAKAHGDDEKTTLESQWDDEASTTAEQGSEVAEKIRDLNLVSSRRPHFTGLTNTGASQVDEPTVDDQNVPLQESVARIVITQGNDAGQEIDIQPGKTYTIGRAIDNDIVLTDISVSRKHFDLRHENGSWVIVDRGSGNGTVVNGNLEDNPFMLANGDVIEIGNTGFRFDHDNGVVHRPSSLDVSVDDEEMSTIAGKGMRGEDAPPTPFEQPHAVRERPKTLPPPTPLRPRGGSSNAPPPMTYQAISPSNPMPATTLPMPQMGGRPPAQAAPLVLGDPAPLGAASIPSLAHHMAPLVQSAPAPLPSTLPGQGPHRMFGGYPQVGDIPAQQLQAQMHLIAAQQGRADQSAHAAAYGYGPPHGAPMQLRYAPQPIGRRTKMILGGMALTVSAAIAALALMRCNTRKSSASSASAKVAVKDAPKPDLAATMKTEPKITPIPTTSTTKAPTPPQQPRQLYSPFLPPAALTKPSTTVTPIAPPKAQGSAAIASTAPAPPPRQDPPKQDPPRQDPPKQDPPKQDPPKIAKQDPPKQDPHKQDPPKQDPPKQEPLRQDPPKQSARKTRTEKRPSTPPAATQTPTPPPRTRVATMSTQDAMDASLALYRQHKFTEASNLLMAQAKNTSDDADARTLRYKSSVIAKLGRALGNTGGSPTDVFDSLRLALDLDGVMSHALDSEISTKLAEVAPKAAIRFFADKNYEKARIAVITADKVGSTGGTLAAAKKNLDSRASQLYSEAMKEFDSDPDAAKETLRTIEKMIDAKNPLYAKVHQKLGP